MRQNTRFLLTQNWDRALIHELKKMCKFHLFFEILTKLGENIGFRKIAFWYLMLNSPCHLYGYIQHRIHNWAPFHSVYLNVYVDIENLFFFQFCFRNLFVKNEDAPCYPSTWFEWNMFKTIIKAVNLWTTLQ